MADIVLGSTVSLKSGGPRMVVEMLDRDKFGNPQALCKWIDSKGQSHAECYLLSSLELSDGSGIA